MTKPAVTILPPMTDFGAVIKKYREGAGLNQGALASLIDVNKNTVNNWERNKRSPDANIIPTLCAALHMPVQELFSIRDTPYALTNDEEVLLSNYRSLSFKTRNLARQAVLAMADEDARQQAQELRDGYYVMSRENTRAAAGPGCPFIDEPEVAYSFVKVSKLSSKADTLFTVSGRSMEPVYHDGDTLYVADANDGDAGDDLICSTADGVVVKRKGDDGRMYSVNSDLPFGNKYEDDNVRVMGKVLGVTQPDDIASDDLVSVLEELLADDVKAFEQEHRR